MTANFTTSDTEKTVVITSGKALSLEDQNWGNLNATISSLNSLVPLGQVLLGSGTLAITTKNARIFTTAISLGANPPSSLTVSPSTTDFWNILEIGGLHNLVTAIVECAMLSQMTDLNIKYF